jgi:hypothetical protein
MTKKYHFQDNILPSISRYREFIAESNKIEGIIREPTEPEVKALMDFYFLDEITIEDLEKFVKIMQPDARLRDEYGLDVRVGMYIPPLGCPEMRDKLRDILTKVNEHKCNSYQAHIMYEKLHPFTDGNGRSGRALWLWIEKDMTLGFLHRFYYQTLNHYSKHVEGLTNE